MKKTHIAGGIAALALAGLIGGVAVAQQAPTERRATRADADGDGRISEAEFVGQRVQRLGAVDADRDGSVTAQERQAGQAARRAERMTARFDRLDADRDGAISRAEFEARPARAQRAGKGPRAAQRAERMAAHRDARAPVVIAEAQTRAATAFARLDADADGFVTIEERRAGRVALREVRQERRAERMARRATQTPPSPPAPSTE